MERLTMDGTLKAAAQLAATLIAAAMLIAGGYLIGRSTQPQPRQPHEVIRVDTLTVHDTITKIRPVSEVRRVVGRVAVPVTAPVADTAATPVAVDTVQQPDTTYVYLEREQVEWSDSLATVWASGIQPHVDSVRHYTQKQIITQQVAVPVPVRRRWGIGVQVGYGASRDGLTPYIGIGVSYNFVTFGKAR